MKTDFGTRGKTIKTLIKDKMQVLDDFGICDKNDKEMKEELARQIEEHPDRDPRSVLDYYCRPMIQMTANRWHK